MNHDITKVLAMATLFIIIIMTGFLVAINKSLCFLSSSLLIEAFKIPILKKDKAGPSKKSEWVSFLSQTL